MPISASKTNAIPRVEEANSVLRELHEAAQSLQRCFDDLEKVLDRPMLDASALTSVRLKLAGIRLTRGPLITRVSELLSGTVTPSEQVMLEQLKSSHYRLLQVATAHTSKWTLEAIATGWAQYRRETRQLMRQWLSKAERDQKLVYPLVERCAEIR